MRVVNDTVHSSLGTGLAPDRYPWKKLTDETIDRQYLAG